MAFLLDSQILLWLRTSPERLRYEVRDRLEDPGSDLLVSAVTVWELGIKVQIGKLRIDRSPLTLARESIARYNALELPIVMRHAEAATRLPPHHRDPFDRMLVAQALVEGLTLVTADRLLAAYGVPLLLT
jgi:PIN domain nuclease of toxin-antitoxin system